MYIQASGNRNFRKRKQDQSLSNQGSSGHLVDDKANFFSTGNNVAESTKVKQYLKRQSSQTENVSHACIKMILCNSEAASLTLEELEALQQEFEIESIYLSESDPLSVDKIITLHGILDCISRCAIYISFLTRSKANNILKNEPFTLKSQNYQINVLIETDELSIKRRTEELPPKSIDISQYETNPGLQLAAITGDFLSLFKTLNIFCRSFNYVTYKADEDIDILQIINVHDGETLHSRLEKEKHNLTMNNSNVLRFVYRAS